MIKFSKIFLIISCFVLALEITSMKSGFDFLGFKKCQDHANIILKRIDIIRNWMIYTLSFNIMNKVTTYEQ